MKLSDIAQKMVTKGQGILAADESTATMTKRLEQINTPSTEDMRRDYREMLFSTDNAMREAISGVILYDETMRQTSSKGTRLVEIIQSADAVAGIKVDTGAKMLALSDGEKITEGLDNLRERLAEYRDLGAGFAKWRAVIEIGEGKPSRNAVCANAHALARYAALCQEAGIVPIVEPEVLMDGVNARHDIETCYTVTSEVLQHVFSELNQANIELEGMILKPNMVIAGQKCPHQASAEEVAEKTVQCLKNNVPSAVAGIAFLSGGQSDYDATRHLDLMNKGFECAWPLTFSYGRALQQAALKTWAGKSENIAKAQIAFAHRAKMNSLAAQGQWSEMAENAT